jgi:hypothetical protein
MRQTHEEIRSYRGCGGPARFDRSRIGAEPKLRQLRRAEERPILAA